MENSTKTNMKETLQISSKQSFELGNIISKKNTSSNNSYNNNNNNNNDLGNSVDINISEETSVVKNICFCSPLFENLADEVVLPYNQSYKNNVISNEKMNFFNNKFCYLIDVEIVDSYSSYDSCEDNNDILNEYTDFIKIHDQCFIKLLYSTKYNIECITKLYIINNEINEEKGEDCMLNNIVSKYKDTSLDLILKDRNIIKLNEYIIIEENNKTNSRIDVDNLLNELEKKDINKYSFKMPNISNNTNTNNSKDNNDTNTRNDFFLIISKNCRYLPIKRINKIEINNNENKFNMDVVYNDDPFCLKYEVELEDCYPVITDKTLQIPQMCYPLGATISTECRDLTAFDFIMTNSLNDKFYCSNLHYSEEINTSMINNIKPEYVVPYIKNKLQFQNKEFKLYQRKSICIIGYEPYYFQFKKILYLLNSIIYNKELLKNIITKIQLTFKIEKKAQLQDLEFTSLSELENLISLSTRPTSSLSSKTPKNDNKNKLLDYSIKEAIYELRTPKFSERFYFKDILPFTHSDDVLLDIKKIISLIKLENIIKIYLCFLLEKKIIFLSEHHSTINYVINAFQTLLTPFKWQHILISILPSSQLVILDAPVPYVIGLRQQEMFKFVMSKNFGRNNNKQKLSDNIFNNSSNISIDIETAFKSHEVCIVNVDTDNIKLVNIDLNVFTVFNDKIKSNMLDKMMFFINKNYICEYMSLKNMRDVYLSDNFYDLIGGSLFSQINIEDYNLCGIRNTNNTDNNKKSSIDYKDTSETKNANNQINYLINQYQKNNFRSHNVNININSSNSNYNDFDSVEIKTTNELELKEALQFNTILNFKEEDLTTKEKYLFLEILKTFIKFNISLTNVKEIISKNKFSFKRIINKIKNKRSELTAVSGDKSISESAFWSEFEKTSHYSNLNDIVYSNNIFQLTYLIQLLERNYFLIPDDYKCDIVGNEFTINNNDKDNTSNNNNYNVNIKSDVITIIAKSIIPSNFVNVAFSHFSYTNFLNDKSLALNEDINRDSNNNSSTFITFQNLFTRISPSNYNNNSYSYYYSNPNYNISLNYVNFLETWIIIVVDLLNCYNISSSFGKSSFLIETALSIIENNAKKKVFLNYNLINHILDNILFSNIKTYTDRINKIKKSYGVLVDKTKEFVLSNSLNIKKISNKNINDTSKDGNVSIKDKDSSVSTRATTSVEVCVINEFSSMIKYKDLISIDEIIKTTYLEKYCKCEIIFIPICLSCLQTKNEIKKFSLGELFNGWLMLNNEFCYCDKCKNYFIPKIFINKSNKKDDNNESNVINNTEGNKDDDNNDNKSLSTSILPNFLNISFFTTKSNTNNKFKSSSLEEKTKHSIQTNFQEINLYSPNTMTKKLHDNWKLNYQFSLLFNILNNETLFWNYIFYSSVFNFNPLINKILIVDESKLNDKNKCCKFKSSLIHEDSFVLELNDLLEVSCISEIKDGYEWGVLELLNTKKRNKIAEKLIDDFIINDYQEINRSRVNSELKKFIDK